jgi:hypothetical protein
MRSQCRSEEQRSLGLYDYMARLSEVGKEYYKTTVCLSDIVQALCSEALSITSISRSFPSLSPGVWVNEMYANCWKAFERNLTRCGFSGKPISGGYIR